jgi:hypothetical protein
MTAYRTKRDINLGVTQSGERLDINPDSRKTHMHVIGASGRGKSYFLEHLIRQDIKNRDGLCLIDPHGELYDHIVSWCASYSTRSWDKLILLDASAPDWTFSFNPLNFGTADTSYSVDSMVKACAQVWGGEDTNATPLLKKALRGIFHVLAEKQLTLLEASYLINERDDFKPVREFITNELDDPYIRDQWASWNEFKPQDFRELFASSSNRLGEFFAASVIRNIFCQTEPVIDFRRVMDDGAVVLVNLASRGRISDFNARTLGTLITNDIFLKANDRPEGSRPFYLYIDECGYYLNESIKRILDESRKRGLHLILANQHLSQLKEAGDTVYKAVMTDAQTKVVFGGLGSEDAETMVKEVFLDLELEEPKKSLTRRVAVGQEKISLKGESEGASASHGSAIAVAQSDGSSKGESETMLPNDGVYEKEGSQATSWGMFHSDSYSELASLSKTVSRMNSWTEAFKTTYENAVGGVYSLEEQRYKKLSWLKKQPKQLALLVQPDFSLAPFRVETVSPPLVTPRMVNSFVEHRRDALPFVQREEQLKLRHTYQVQKLLERAGVKVKDLAPEDFWTED